MAFFSRARPSTTNLVARPPPAVISKRTFLGGNRDPTATAAKLLADVTSSNAQLWQEHMQLEEQHAKLEREFVKLSERFKALVSAHEAMADRMEKMVAREREKERLGPLFWNSRQHAPPGNKPHRPPGPSPLGRH